MNQKNKIMTPFDYLYNVLTWGSAFVPAELAKTIVNAAGVLGVAVSGGMYNAETNSIILYKA